MENQKNNFQENYAIDVLHILKTLWRRAWIIVLSGLLAAAIGFSISAFVIAPTYSSAIMLYVNNNSFSVGNTSFSISSSQISAAQSLVKTYSEILKNRTTLERIIDKADLSYTHKQLSGMISAAPSNNTEIMKVTVVTEDPYEAAKIANTIAEVLPVRIAEIIDGASMEVVDSAVPNLEKIAPNVAQHTGRWLAWGVVLSAIILAMLVVFDDTIHDEDYVLQNYEYPILGTVPDLLNSGSEKYGYYYSQNAGKGRNAGTEG